MGVFQKRNKLSKLKLDEVSLVPSGDDPMAEVVLAKADPDDKTSTEHGAAPTLNNDGQGSDMPTENDDTDDIEIDLTGVSPEVIEYIEALEDEVTRNDVVSEILDLAEDDLDTEPEVFNDEVEALAKADPAIRSLIEKAEQRAAEAEAVAKAERDLRVHREFVAKAEAMPMITERPEDLAEVFKAVSDVDPQLGQVIVDILAAANEQIAKGSLFAEFGSEATNFPGSERLTAKADEIRKSNPEMTPEQAAVAAMESDPSLYDESL